MKRKQLFSEQNVHRHKIKQKLNSFVNRKMAQIPWDYKENYQVAKKYL